MDGSVNARHRSHPPTLEAMRVPGTLTGLIAGAVALFAQPRILPAQTIPSPYQFIDTRQEAGAFTGWIAPGTGQFGYGPGPGPIAGARYELGFGSPISLEGVVGVITSTRDIVDPRRVEGNRVIGDTPAKMVTADARLKLSITGPRTWHGLNPFVLVGAGLAWDLAEGSELEEDLAETDRFDFGTSFVAELGGGLRWFVTEQVILRADGLFYLWRLEAPLGFRDPERGFENVGQSEWANATGITLGVGYRF